jgi:hypothetical protein
MADPTSWLAVQPGWELVDRSGTVIGEITELLGDFDSDIFDGLRFETTAGEELFVRAERVADIVEGTVSLDADLPEIEAEPEAEADE